MKAKLMFLIAIAGASGCNLFRFDTMYAPGYSATAFNEIAHGMTKAEVLRRLGEPLYCSTFSVEEIGGTYDQGGEALVYSAQGQDKMANYHERTIFIGENGRVIGIKKGVYWD